MLFENFEFEITKSRLVNTININLENSNLEIKNEYIIKGF